MDFYIHYDSRLPFNQAPLAWPLLIPFLYCSWEKLDFLVALVL